MSTHADDLTLGLAGCRGDFPILARQMREGVPLVYFDNAASSQRPRQVIQSLVACYEEHYANVHRGIHTLAQESDDLFENARTKVQAFIHAETAEQCVFTSGATAGLNMIARSWGDAFIKAGDEIVLTEMEHHANLVPWQQLAKRSGAVLRHIPLADDGQLALDRLDDLLSKRTKIVAFTAVSNVLGTINPAAEIVRRAHDVGAIAVIDGAQSVPHGKTDVQAWDADFLVFSGHKMLGPSGVGVLYGKRELLDRMPPFLGGGDMIRRVFLSDFVAKDSPAKLEAGTPPIVPAIGLGAAVDYLQQIGADAIHEHEQRLLRHAHKLLHDVKGLHIYGPAVEHKAGIVCFTVDDVHPHDLAEMLNRDGIAIRAGHHCAMPLHERLGIDSSARASFYFYNTLAEIDRLADALHRTVRFFTAPRGKRS